MRLLAATATALTVLGFAGAASAACAWSDRNAVDQTAQTPPIVKPKTQTTGA